MDHNEQKWQEIWSTKEVFRAIPDNREKYLITVPWPYTSGPLHVGHARTYSIADFIARYKRLRDYNVMFPMGFHESGTPILAISQRLKRGDQKTIDLYSKYLSEYEDEGNVSQIIETFKEQEALAGYFADKIMKDFNSLGFSIDWSRQFKSVDPVYQDFVSWQFKKLRELGLISQGSYPILYSADEKSAVGEDDIEDGDTDKVSIEEFVSIIFPGDEYGLVTSTLRPETLSGATNIWISERGKYYICELNSKKIVVSESAKEKLSQQEHEIRVISEIDQEKLISKSFRNPYNGNELKVFKAEFVDPDNATGIVSSVPTNSIIDYLQCLKLGITIDTKPFIKIGTKYSTAVSYIHENHINIDNSEEIERANVELYKKEFYEGTMEIKGFPENMKVSEVRKKITDELKAQGNAFVFFETSRKARTRSGANVTVAVFSTQWFLDYSNDEWKKKSHESVNRMTFYPSHYKKGMNEVIDWLRERPCARMRGLGTKLPFDNNWIIESLSDSTIYPAVYTCIDFLNKIREVNGKLDCKTLEYIFMGKGKNEDPIINEALKWFRYWYGVDMRITAFPHFTNHLAFYIMNHVAILPDYAQPVSIMIAGTMVSNGKKISKSKGNSISLLKVSRDYGADLYRLYVAVTSDPTSEVDWNEEDIATVRSKFEDLKKLLNSVIHSKEVNQKYASQWFLESFHLHLKKYIENMDSMNIRLGFIEIFYEVLNDVSKLRMRGGNVEASIRSIMQTWLKALSVVIPHTAEELWHQLGNDTLISSETFLKEDLCEPDMNVIAAEKYLDNVVSDIREVIKVTGRKPSEILISVCNTEISSAVRSAMAGEEIKPEMRWIIPFSMKNRKFIRQGINEIAIILENSEYLMEIFSCKFGINVEEPERGQKKIALPGKPMIKLI
ncbi:MAG: leucine--tRNA ligase [Thermoplasmataceae archaeon]